LNVERVEGGGRGRRVSLRSYKKLGRSNQESSQKLAELSSEGRGGEGQYCCN